MNVIPIIDARALIPRGVYCYEGLDVSRPASGFPVIRYKRPCPFLSSSPHQPSQMNGYCSFMKKGDWETGGLLWDAVKECGIKTDDEEFGEEPNVR